MAVDKSKAQIALHKVDPAGMFQDTVTALLNNYNPRSLPVTTEQLNNATLDKAFNFYKDRFADAGNFTFTFVGNFTVEQIMPFLERYVASLPSTNRKETYKNLGSHPVAGQVSKTIHKGTGERATVELVFSGPYDYNEDNNIQMDALEEVLNLRFAIKLPEKESGALSLGASVNYVKIPEARYKITISFACLPANTDKIISAILNEVNNLKQVGAEQKEINTFDLEESKSIRAQLKQNYFWAGYLASSAQYDEDPDRIIPHIQRLNQVTIESTKAAANKYLNSGNLIRLVLLPEKK
jgi:zinc protease